MEYIYITNINAYFLVIILFLSSCSGVFYQPHRKIYTTPDKFNVEYEEVTIPSKGPETLSAWLLKSAVPLKGTIVFFHGNAENISTHFFQMAWLTKFGYQILVFDYRGYGNSTGAPDRKGIYYDSQQAIKKGWDIHRGSKGSDKFIVYGQSLGGIIAPPAISGLEFEDKIDLMVLDSTFDSYQGIAFDKLTSSWITFIFSPLAYILVSDDLASEDFLPKLKCKGFLVLHGSEDYVVPEKFGKRVFKSLPSTKEFRSFEGMTHIQAFAKEENRNWFKNYLDSVGLQR